MTSGSHKRKSTRKKRKKAKPTQSSGSTPVHSPPDGESDGGKSSSSASNSRHNSPLPPVKPETTEDNSSAIKPSTTEKEGKIEIDRWPQEKSSIPRSSSSPNNKHHDKKKSVVIEPAPREKLHQKSDSKNNHPKETGLEQLVEKLVSVEEKASPESTKDCLTASSLNCPFCGRGGGGDRVVKEQQTPESPEKHPLLSSNPRAAEKASWSSCCGIFELCSRSSR
ncbi:hypothetical protein LXL04_010982 [Taraxacum kok-saghyz]